MDTSKDPTERLAREFERLERENVKRFEMSIAPAELLLITGMVQLAAKHPGVTERHRLAADIFVDFAEKYYEAIAAPCCLEVLERRQRQR